MLFSFQQGSSSVVSWRVDLSKTECYWKGWFQGLSKLFLSSSVAVPKLLILAGTYTYVCENHMYMYVHTSMQKWTHAPTSSQLSFFFFFCACVCVQVLTGWTKILQ